MVTTAWTNGTEAKNTGTEFFGWNNPGWALVEDSEGASQVQLPTGQHSIGLSVYGFGFDIPTNAVIDNIEARVKRIGGPDAIQDYSLYIGSEVYTGTTSVVVESDNLAKPDLWQPTYMFANYAIGGNAGLTPEDVNGLFFGTQLKVSYVSSTPGWPAQVDVIQMRISYRIPGTVPNVTFIGV